MNYYRIFLKDGNEIFTKADRFEIIESLKGISFFVNDKSSFVSEELVSYFDLEEIIGCIKISKTAFEEILEEVKENNNGERNDC